MNSTQEKKQNLIHYKILGSSLVAHSLELRAFTVLAWVHSLAGELRFCKLQDVAKEHGKKLFSTFLIQKGKS